MKNTKAIFSIIAIVSVVIFSSCKKTSTTVDPVPVEIGAFTYKVDGGATIFDGHMIVTKIIKY